MLACVQFIVRVQLVHVSVKIDHRLRVGTVHVSHTPDSGVWKVCVSVDQGLRVEVVYVSHMPHSISGKLGVRLDRGLRVARVGMVHVSFWVGPYLLAPTLLHTVLVFFAPLLC